MGAVEVMCVLQRGHSGDGCDLETTLCKYDLFVLSWTRVRRVREVSLQARCIETIYVCIWHIFVFMSVVVTV